MTFTNTKESGLENLIVRWLVEHNGYEQGTNDDYNREYAVDETRLFRFLQDTQPEALEKLGVFKSDIKKKQFLNRLQGELAKRGIIDVLRNGVKIYPANLIMFYLTPTENNAKAKALFEKDIFRPSRMWTMPLSSTRLTVTHGSCYSSSSAVWCILPLTMQESNSAPSWRAKPAGSCPSIKDITTEPGIRLIRTV